MKPAWQPMRDADLPAVAALADRIHLAHPEAPEVFAERFRLFPQGCLALREDSAVVGYAIAHPGRLGAPPRLNTSLEELPERADCLYLHDIALAPEIARRGHGSDLMARLVELAIDIRLPCLALVAVGGSAPFWERLGFRAVDDPALRAKLASYGTGAAYMLRKVAPVRKPDGL